MNNATVKYNFHVLSVSKHVLLSSLILGISDLMFFLRWILKLISCLRGYFLYLFEVVTPILLSAQNNILCTLVLYFGKVDYGAPEQAVPFSHTCQEEIFALVTG